MEFNIGGFTDVGENTFNNLFKEYFSKMVITDPNGGQAAYDPVTTKATCAVDEVALACVDNYYRINLVIRNNGTTTAYVRKIYTDSAENTAANVIAYGFPLAPNETITFGRCTGGFLATANGASMDLRVLEVVQVV